MSAAGEVQKKIGKAAAFTVGLLLLGLNPYAVGQSPPTPAIDLRQASLEDLMEISVTSVSKRAEKLSRAAAAIFVITREDIRRSGATNIPDLLRMVPGVNVEQIDASIWAISIRGFNAQRSNKVLVLVDGRTVYDPTFSGVSWDQIEMPLGNIERIEVLRGPGATVWGSNAVNGVISIITKSSKDTKGGAVTALGGSQTSAVGQIQYGGTAGRNATYRAFGDFFEVGNSAAKNGGPANDRWQRRQVGFRSDWDPTPRDSLMVQGNLFSNLVNESDVNGLVVTPFSTTFAREADSAGGDLLAHWTHTLAGGSQTSLQTYYDTYRRNDLGAPAKIATFDLDFQHHVSAGSRNEIVWGLGYRSNYSGFSRGYAISFEPLKSRDNLYNVFLQDEIRISNSVWLDLGAKVEHNRYTGFETEPSVRVIWAPPAGHYSVWAAASQATREPSRVDTEVRVPLLTTPIDANTVQVLVLTGNPHIKTEQIRDYELGYRAELSKNLSLDATSFLSFYRHLGSGENQAPFVIPGSPVQIETPLLIGSQAHAVDVGGELFVTWKATPRWTINPGYSYLHAKLRADGNSNGTANISTEFPQHMLQIRSLFNVSRRIEFDQSLYYRARLPGGSIPGRARLDLRLARKFGESTELSLVGQNLLHKKTLEYGDGQGVVGTQVLRSVYGKVTWRF